ncbi:MAG TPA: hypothetical protein VMX35_13065 [Acidobacteriota bacterium]|nr:hypothetical protein [Acidobacteriota bacterium]
MSAYPSVSDFWQIRCRRLGKLLPDGHVLKDLAGSLWESFKEETHQLAIPGVEGDRLNIKVLSVQQGPTRRYAFYEWQHVPESFHQVQRARAVHANLRCAFAGTANDKILGAVNVNLQELLLTQVDKLCEQMAAWWEKNEDTYLSPFSQMAYVMRNWLDGVYGDKPVGEHPSLDALKEIDIGPRELIAECAKSIYSILKQQLKLNDEPEIGLIGIGSWAESVTSELRCLGAICDRFDHVPVGREREIFFLIHNENCITADEAARLKCKALVEMIPGQINPEADELLKQREILIVPDLLCSCAQEIMEDWWLGGRRMPGWAMVLFIRLQELWDELQKKREELDANYHDAAFLTALEKLADRWHI